MGRHTMTSLEMRQARAKLIEDAGKILTRAHEDSERPLTAEESTEFERMHKRADELRKSIEATELQESRSKEIAEIVLDTPEDLSGGAEKPDARSVFRKYLRGGMRGMTPEERAVAREYRTQTTQTDSSGGYLIPEGFQAELDKRLLAFGGMRQAARVVTTASGNPLPWPTVDDTGNTGRLLTENTGVTNIAVAYGVKTLNAYKYSSDSILVPSELMQDSAFDMEAHLEEMLAERLGRITNSHLTVGTGSGQPNGVVTAAADSAVNFSLGGGASSWYDEMVDVYHSVDPAYRMSPSCAWMCTDDFAADLKKVTDSNGRPIFRAANEAAGDVDTVLGKPVFINQEMEDASTATNKHLIFGDFSKYIVRVVRPMQLIRLNERYADDDQVGFFAFERLDGELLNTNAIKWAEIVA